MKSIPIKYIFLIGICFALGFAILNSVSPPPSADRGPDFTDAPTQNENSKHIEAEPEGENHIIDWRILRELNVTTGKRSPELDKLNNQFVSIPGFMVPFEDNMGQAQEFLLVPSPQACIHVPPPPPNQMIYVKMPPGRPAKMQWIPIWVSGKFRIMTNDSPYGKVSYYIEGRYTKPFGGAE